MQEMFPKSALLFYALTAAFTHQITIHNNSNYNIFLAPYYVKYDVATRIGEPISIKPKSNDSLIRPGRIWGQDREIFFSTNMEDLKETISGDDIHLMPHQNIGTLQGVDFYIAMVDFKLQCFDFIDWNIIEPLSQSGAKIVKETLKPLRSVIKKHHIAIKNNPYKDKIAYLRSGNNLSTEEKNFLSVRMPKVKKSLENVLHISLQHNNVPVIAVVGSGGGIRATLMSLGGLTGLAKIGLLDTVTYVVGLSGSTWAIAPWITYNKPIEQAKDLIISLLEHGIKKISPIETKLMIDALLVKWTFEQSITLVDLYGLLLANTLLQGFGKSKQSMYLSDQSSIIKNGNYPLPIYTAVCTETSKSPAWYEFTPYEIGSTWLNCYIPTWGFGRSFVTGTSQDNAPEQSLGYLMGIFGSAFAATFDAMYQELVDNLPADIIKNIAELILKEVGKKRLTSAELCNFSFGFANSPLKGEKQIKMADAGLAFNLPYPPICGERSERKADIIIFFDATKEPKEKASALKGAEEYAHKHNLPFPPITYDRLKDKSITVFTDKNNTASPVVIYMPLTKDQQLTANFTDSFKDLLQLIKPFDFWECMQNTCDTFNFAYDEKEAQTLSALMEFNVRANEMLLKDTISQWCTRR